MKNVFLKEKKCTACGVSKAREFFHLRNKNGKYIRSKCIDCSYKIAKDYRKNNRQKYNLQKKNWRDKNKEKILEYRKRDYERHSESYKKRASERYLENTEKCKKQNTARDKIRRVEDEQYRLAKLVRSRLNILVKYNLSKGVIVDSVGLCATEFKSYIESRFSPGMKWIDGHRKNNWEFDHIKPLSSFDLQDIVQFAAASHYSNVQPLWKKDNIKKGTK